MWKWLKRLGAVVTALVAAWFMWRSGRHAKAQKKLATKARRLETDKNESMNQAMAARKKYQAAKAREAAAKNEVEARIDELEDTNKTLAGRVRAYNDRRLRRGSKSP